MAQGKLKVKAKKPAGHNKGGNSSRSQHKAGKVTKKGRKTIAPKKAKAQEAFRLHRTVEKGIKKNIEETLANRAKQVEEGKAFSVINTSEATDKKGKK